MKLVPRFDVYPRKRLLAIERASREPIAIVGVACRFPGGAHDPESYWKLLREGKTVIREVPRAKTQIRPEVQVSIAK